MRVHTGGNWIPAGLEFKPRCFAFTVCPFIHQTRKFSNKMPSTILDIPNECFLPLSPLSFLPHDLGTFIWINQYLWKVLYFTWSVMREKGGIGTEKVILLLRDLMALYYVFIQLRFKNNISIPNLAYDFMLKPLIWLLRPRSMWRRC